MPSGPLQRFRVLDASRVRSGPTAVRQFADWGTQVIKVEGLDEAGGVGAGDHTDEILHGLSHDAVGVARLRERQVV